MKRRIISVLLVLVMALTLLPTAAFATEEDVAAPAERQEPVCVCEAACTEEAMNADCPICGAEGAHTHDCARYQDGEKPAVSGAAQPGAEPEKQPEGEEKPQPAEQPESGAPDADEPEESAAQENMAVQSDDQGIALLAADSHTHCICGGSVRAGDHTSHSDVTYTAWNDTDGISYTNNTAYVYLTGNAILSGHLTVDGKTLYLCLNGKTLSSNNTAKIQVKNGGRLVLCDCQGGGTFKGATQSVWGGACIYLYTSTLDMFGGKLTGGKVTGKGGGGAIALDDQQCTFNMYGGEISGNNGKNYGGAIFRKFNANMPNTTGGTFNMYGGTIKDNTAKNGGAFFSTTGGTINMTGGTISGNKATQSSNDAGGGAIYMRGNGKINISGSAEITGNSSSLDGGAILMGWGTINISGSAKINNNTASRWGGAICLRQDSNQTTILNMRGGEISGNKATKEGGAVHVLDKDCQFFLYDGKITGNTSGDGGAIYLNQEPSWLIMQGGEISGNTATGNGGGVYIYRSGSVCQLYSGKIENNKASGNGGGIYINPSNSGQLRVGNKPLVQNNTVSGKANNVYLPSGKTLTIEIGMSKGASIGVTTANTSYPVAFSNNYKKDYANYFFADDANAHVEYKDDQKLYLVSGAVARPLTVTFDPNGGTLAEADKTRSLMTGDTYGTLPVPSYEGYDFAGWYTEQNGGTKIEGNTTVTVFGTQTLYAHWTPVHVHAYTQQVQKPEALKTPADCTNDAVYYLSCECGEVSTNDADTFTAANTALDHDWDAWTQNSDGSSHTRICKRDANHRENGTCSGGTATCTAKAKCSTCNAEYGEKLPHDFTAETAGEQYLKSGSSCTEKAVYYNSCTVCGLSSKGTASEATFESGNILGHNWGQWTQNSDGSTHTRTCSRNTSHTETGNCSVGTATCTDKATCPVCGSQYGAPLNHDFSGEWQHDADRHWKKCSRCDGTTPTEPHTWDNGTVTKQPTCTTAGERKYTCAVCSATKTDTIPATGHSWKREWTSDATHHWHKCANQNCDVKVDSGKDGYAPHTGGEATCTAQAVCATCNQPYGALNSTNHDWNEWKSNGDDTHTRVCKRNDKHTETKDCSGGTATCTEKAKCDVCKAEYGGLAPDNHSDLRHVKAKDATTSAEGNIEYWYCADCGKYYKDAAATKEIGKKDTVTPRKTGVTANPVKNPYQKDDGKKTDGKTIQSGKTGDSGVALYAAMALLSLTGGAWTVGRKRR